jgi:beta-xylosidase
MTTEQASATRRRLPAWTAIGLALVSLAAAIAAGLGPVSAAQGSAGTGPRAPWQPDNGDGTYRNPVLFADYSDPDVARAGDDYYMVSSSFNAVPAIPVLHSRDLVNWRLIGHAAASLPSPRYDAPQHGNGVWAPSLRYHAGRFWVYFGDPDLGIFMTSARNPGGPWEPLTLVRQAKGWIDPCPFWDDDGRAYLVHAWAKSRAGFNGVLTVNRMTADGRTLLDDGVQVFDGATAHPTIEGPKFYKRNGFYYIFAPAGGVKPGWQTVLRSKGVTGPYEDRIVLHQGRTSINGPHQGGWVETPKGDSWFLHFQDRGAYGRVVHLQPMVWRDDWPVIGEDPDGDGRGEPVLKWKKPSAVGGGGPTAPATSDEFSETERGLQWQWNANPKTEWASLTARPGFLRVVPQSIPSDLANLWLMPSLLFQKFPAPSFTATARIDARALGEGASAGLLVMGLDYAYLSVSRSASGLTLSRATCAQADKKSPETVDSVLAVPAGPIELRVTVDANASCLFSYSGDGRAFKAIGPVFAARPGMWIGARVGLFATARPGVPASGHADIDWFRIE